jgi:penicillin-binding protein 2
VTHRYRDWKKEGHGTVNLHRSLVISCDTYYYQLAVDLGVDAIHDYLVKFGLGSRTGIDIEGELAGIAPSQSWKWNRFKQKWYTGDTVSIGIGQGYMLATPIQLAAMTATLANGGTPIHPRLLKAVQDAKTLEVKPIEGSAGERVAIKPEHLELVRSAMVGVTSPGGTAHKAGLNAGYTIAGKTGTAQVVGMKQDQKYDASKIREEHRDHALFIAFAPADDPKLAMALLVENGGSGSGTAAPIAREVFDFFILGKRPAAKQALDPDS